jgi:hypothetical protein
MLTTAGAALRAAPLRLPGIGSAGLVGGASSKEIEWRPGRFTPRSQPGCKVATTNHAATRTVMVCEKSSQRRFMEENSARKEGEGAKDPNALGVNTRGAIVAQRTPQ